MTSEEIRNLKVGDYIKCTNPKSHDYGLIMQVRKVLRYKGTRKLLTPDIEARPIKEWELLPDGPRTDMSSRVIKAGMLRQCWQSANNKLAIYKMIMQDDDLEGAKKILNSRVANALEDETFGAFIEFFKNLDDFDVEYDLAAEAVAQATNVAFQYFAMKFGITGFQGGCAFWIFVDSIFYPNRKSCGYKMIDFADMIYPQYRDRFERVMGEYQWENVQNLAKEHLESGEDAAEEVKAHWQSIVDGKVPFGWSVKKEDE